MERRKSQWAKITCERLDETDDLLGVCAWFTLDPDEEGEVIATVDPNNGNIEFYEDAAIHDEYVCEVIRKALRD